MTKGIALTPISCGYLDDKGKNIVKAFEPDDKLDLPDEMFADLLKAGAVAEVTEEAPPNDPPPKKPTLDGGAK